MNVSHVEVEINVRLIDRRNVPICNKVYFFHQPPFLVYTWLKKNVSIRSAAEFIALYSEAEFIPDRYDYKAHNSSHIELSGPKAESEGMDSGIQSTLFSEDFESDRRKEMAKKKNQGGE